MFKQNNSRMKKTALLLSGLIAAAALALPSLADAAALDQFKTFIAGTKAAKGEFTQQSVHTDTPSKNSTKPSKTSSGTFVFARPGQFIWVYQKPYEQTLQSDGVQLYIFDKDLNQVTTKKLGNALGSSPAAILFGSNDLEKNFSLKEDGAKDGVEWLLATPKTKDTTVDHVRIGLRDNVPQAMELTDTFGQTSMLTFTKFEKNPIIATDQFKFVIPKGADVLQQ